MMNPLSEAQKMLVGVFTIALVVLAIWGYGKYQHHAGYNQCQAEAKVVVDKLKEVSKNAIIENETQADSDKRMLVDYYNGLLSNRTKLPRSGVQTGSASGVPATACEYPIAEEDLRFEQRCAEDGFKLLRVIKWIEVNELPVSDPDQSQAH
jgi:hypothetical protein